MAQLKNTLSPILSLVCSVVIPLSVAFAIDPTPSAPTPTPLPQTGSIASTTNRGFGAKGSDVWGGTSLDGNNVAPISGSVSRSGARSWVMKLFNNTKDSYSVDVAVEQTNAAGSKVKTDSFSISLGANEKSERTVSAHPSSAGAGVNMRGWKKTSKAEVTPTAVASPVAPTEEEGQTKKRIRR